MADHKAEKRLMRSITVSSLCFAVSSRGRSFRSAVFSLTGNRFGYLLATVLTRMAACFFENQQTICD
jgi:hypothetical protein